MRNNFFLALITVIIFETISRLINPFGVSFTKIALTLLLWISCLLALSAFFSNYRKIKENQPSYAFYLFLAIIIWNLISICRSAISGDEPITTLLGNNETSLALLVPFCLAFSIDSFNLRILNRFFIGLLLVAIPGFLLFVVFSSSENYFYNKAFSVLFYGIFFLIPLIPFQSRQIKVIIFLGSIFLSFLAILTDYRIMIIRIALLYLSIFAMYLYRVLNLKFIIYLAIFSLTIPFYLVVESVITGVSAFEKYRPETRNEDLNDDTRTFLYTEVYDDLQKNKQLLIGKGSSEPYYSPYFDEYGGDTSQRLSVEVGILALLLKGGYIAVILNVSIFLIAILLAFFYSNNYFVMYVGFMLVIHLLILFITNYIDYTIYNVALWFFIGLCISKEIRSLDDNQILNILQNGESS